MNVTLKHALPTKIWIRTDIDHVYKVVRGINVSYPRRRMTGPNTYATSLLSRLQSEFWFVLNDLGIVSAGIVLGFQTHWR
jgi:hypothetical protein